MKRFTILRKQLVFHQCFPRMNEIWSVSTPYFYTKCLTCTNKKLLVSVVKQTKIFTTSKLNQRRFYTIFCCTQYPIHVLYNTLKPKCSQNNFGTTSWFCVTWIDDTIVTIPCYIIIVHNELDHQLSIRSWSSQVSRKCYLHDLSSAPPP